MSEIAVRLLDEDGWQDYRDMRLAALRESAQAFLATYAEEAMQPEQYWRHCMVRADRLLAESDGAPEGATSTPSRLTSKPGPCLPLGVGA